MRRASQLITMSMRSSLVWILWLIDVVQALHFNLSTHFSSSELWTKMPSTVEEFQVVYHALIHDAHKFHHFYSSQLPRATFREDGLLLLIAIISDSICLNHALGPFCGPTMSEEPTPYEYNPFVPFTPSTENRRIQASLEAALDRWDTIFHDLSSSEMLALHCYAKLYLSYPDLQILPQLVGYGPLTFGEPGSFESFTTLQCSKVSHHSAQLAWLVLDHVASPKRTVEVMCPSWLPIAVFHAALVVWAKASFTTDSMDDRHGSTRALLAFQVELEKMCYPCCVEMAATLKRLNSNVSGDV